MGYSSSSLALSFPQSICEWINLSLPLYQSSSPQRVSQAGGHVLLWDIDKSNTTTIEAQDYEHMQRTAGPDMCRAELCWDVLVKMICLLWGSREDVEKTAPSQLLQGVLQCRGVTEKYEARRQFVQQSAPNTLPPFPAMPHFFPSSLLWSFIFLLIALLSLDSHPSVFLYLSLSLTNMHTNIYTQTLTLKALAVLWPVITAAMVNREHHMVVVGSVHWLQWLGILNIAVGQHNDGMCVCSYVCMFICKHWVDFLWTMLSGWMSKRSSCTLTAAFHYEWVPGMIILQCQSNVKDRGAATTRSMSTWSCEYI